ncbi:cupin domain-containing protein [Tistrella bauzanensis]
MDDGPWAPFPDAFSAGGITWKLLHVSPEAGSWTAIFTCPAGSSFAAHIHTGPGEYFLTRGRMDVRGGRDQGAIPPWHPAMATNPRARAMTGPSFLSRANST